MPAVGYLSHRRMWGTKHHLEHLMRRHPKRQNGCGAREVTLSHVEVKETCGISIPKSKPHFSPRIRGKKKRVLSGYCRAQEFR